MEARLIGIKGGWAALGQGWAVFGESKSDALAKYRDAMRRHESILSRGWPWETSQNEDTPSALQSDKGILVA